MAYQTLLKLFQKTASTNKAYPKGIRYIISNCKRLQTHTDEKIRRFISLPKCKKYKKDRKVRRTQMYFTNDTNTYTPYISDGNMDTK